MRRFLTIFIKSNINQKNYYKEQHIHKSRIVCEILKIYHLFLSSSLKFLAITNDRIPRINFNVKINMPPVDFKELVRGSINTTANQAAARFTNNSERTSNQAGDSKFINLIKLYSKFEIFSMILINLNKKTIINQAREVGHLALTHLHLAGAQGHASIGDDNYPRTGVLVVLSSTLLLTL